MNFATLIPLINLEGEHHIYVFGSGPGRNASNVELVTAEKVGSETTTYVRNIFKYHQRETHRLPRADRLERLRRLAGRTIVLFKIVQY